jgi:hypothetical protein
MNVKKRETIKKFSNMQLDPSIDFLSIKAQIQSSIDEVLKIPSTIEILIREQAQDMFDFDEHGGDINDILMEMKNFMIEFEDTSSEETKVALYGTTSEVKVLVATCNLTDLEVKFKELNDDVESSLDFYNCVKYLERY